MNEIKCLLRIICGLCVLLFAQTSAANNSLLQIGINGDEEGVSIHRSTYYLIDPDSTYTAEQISAANNLSSYKQLVDSNSWVKQTRGSVWTRVILKNTQDTEININLEYPFNQPSTVYLYHRTLHSNDQFEKLKTDIRDTSSNRSVPAPRLTLPLTLTPLETKEVILETFSDIATPRFTEFRVWSNQAIMEASNIEHIIFGMVSCFIVIAALISAFVYHVLKEKFFIWFSLFAISSVPVLGLTTGIINLYIPNLDYHPLGTISVVVMLATGIQFIRAYSNVAFHSLKTDKLLHIAVMLVLSTIPIAVIGFHELAMQVQQLALFIFPVAVIAAIYCGVQGEHSITTMVLAKTLFFITLMVTNLQAWGWVSPSYGIVFLPTIGMVAQLVCLIWAMYSRANYQFELSSNDNIESITHAYEKAFALQERVREQNQKLKAAKEQAEFEARTDMLTQLPNRRAFMNLAKMAIAQSHRMQQPLSFISFDIDNFKRINDEYGHPAGDETLKVIAALTRHIIRASDFCGRIGGEEFMIGCHNNSAVDAQHIAERLRRKIAETIVYFDGLSFSTTISVGIATVEPNDDLESLIKKSDMAMYDSKTTGKNKVTLYAA